MTDSQDSQAPRSKNISCGPSQSKLTKILVMNFLEVTAKIFFIGEVYFGKNWRTRRNTKKYSPAHANPLYTNIRIFLKIFRRF